MNKWIVLMALTGTVSAQPQASNDAERLRISNERVVREAAFSREDSACYQKFLVSSCLDEVKLRRQDVLADLRRQEILLNDQERKDKGAAQVKKREDKDSPDKQQQSADKRAEALKDFDERMVRDQQKIAGRVGSEANEKTKLQERASRIKSAQDKQVSRATQQAAASEEVKKYQQRIEKSQERQAKLAKEKANQPKPSANPLPIPN